MSARRKTFSRKEKGELAIARDRIDQAIIEASADRPHGGHRHRSDRGLRVETHEAAMSVLRRRVMAQAREAEQARRAALVAQ